MRDEPAEAAGLVCPVCRKPGPDGMEFGKVAVHAIEEESEGWIITGSMKCVKCGAEYPVVDGVPCVLRNAEAWLAAELAVCADPPELPKRWRGMKPGANQREQAPAGRTPASERALADSYMEFHYGQFAEGRDGGDGNAAYWRTAFEAAGSPGGFALDLGCSVGRYAFELAKSAKLVVGLDIRLEPLRQAARLQRTGKASYGLRVGGRGRETAAIGYSTKTNVLFVAGDALDPPFEAGSFDFVAAMNLLDNVPYPLVLLGQMDALLRPGGEMVIGTPYEWREDVCHPSEWLEADGLGPDETLRRALRGELFPDAGLAYDIELDLHRVPWSMRIHDRHGSRFESHVVRARKSGNA